MTKEEYAAVVADTNERIKYTMLKLVRSLDEGKNQNAVFYDVVDPGTGEKYIVDYWGKRLERIPCYFREDYRGEEFDPDDIYAWPPIGRIKEEQRQKELHALPAV